MRRPLSSYCLASILLSAASAGAQSAEDQIATGVRLRREGRDAEALVQFRAAYESNPSPRAVAQMALAEQALGRWAAAAAHLWQALESPDEWVRTRAAALAEAATAIREHVTELRAPRGCLVFSEAAPGVQIRFVTRELPVALAITCGERTRRTSVTPSSSELALELPDVQPGPSGPAPTREVRATPGGGSSRPSSVVAPHPISWVLGAAGLCGSAVAIALLVRRNELADQFNSASCTPQGLSRGEACGHLRQEVAEQEAASAISASLAVAMISAGVTVGILTRSRAHVGVSASSSGFLVSVGGAM